MLVIIGLGNPGKKYASTYHNIGFSVVDGVAKHYNEKFSSKLFDSEIASFFVGHEKIMLVKPMTYMNNSGTAVSAITRKFKLNPATDILVVSDDIDIAPGTIRFRSSTSGSTHNGIRSIVEDLGTKDFMRLKVSIAPKDEKFTLSNFVLSRIKNPETKEALLRATDAVIDLIETHDLEHVMQKYNN